jgi:hypothetical protein
MTRESVEQLFSKLNVDPAFAMNIIGRPDYWSPMTRLRFDDEDALQSCGTARAQRNHVLT